ncbi:MAG: PEP-CTERM sorting domain-containing protein [Pseudomonadales bacterium]
MKSLKVTAAALCLSLASAGASAALISTDLNNAADGLLTLDTDTGLEWLDLTETFNMSIGQVQPLLNSGASLSSFRLAEVSEVHTLMSNAGLPVSTTTGTISSAAADLGAANALTALLGETVGAHYGSRYNGVRGHLLDNGVDRVVGAYTISGTRLFNDFFAGRPTWPGAGVWLVRSANEVSEPGTMAAFALGLFGLGFARRRKAG